MYETSKTKQVWTDHERAFIKGEGIDIGCGPDPVSPTAVRFDIEHGDANFITRYVNRQFDYVFSSHCLEHMRHPRRAILEWWSLVRTGGVLFLIVPDEDLYEQGIFPSRFNTDHKWTFTISKHRSWSPVSINLLELVSGLPQSRLLSMHLQDNHYDRRLLTFGSISPRLSARLGWKAYCLIRSAIGLRSETVELFIRRRLGPIDQTLNERTLAQIQAIVMKV